jgi:peptide chain release factor 3
MVDASRRKQLAKGIEQLAQEGTIQLYRPASGASRDIVLGAVGTLQLEVVRYRLDSEYDVDVRLESIPYSYARWVTRKGGGDVDPEVLRKADVGIHVVDVRGRPVLLFQNEWQLGNAPKYLPEDYVLGETAHGVVVRE